MGRSTSRRPRTHNPSTIRYIILSHTCVSHNKTAILGLDPTKVVFGQILAGFTRDFLNRVASLSKDFVGLRIAQRKVNNRIITRLPIHGRRQFFVHGKLQAVNDTNDFVKVSSSRGRVGHHEGNGFVGLENENRANGERQALGVLVGFVQDAQSRGVGASGVGNERKLDLGSGGNFDVFNPCLVGGSVIARETDWLDVLAVKGVLAFGRLAQFGGANRSEVTWMHKHETPRVTEVLIEIKLVRILRGRHNVGELEGDERFIDGEESEQQLHKPKRFLSYTTPTLSLMVGPPGMVKWFDTAVGGMAFKVVQGKDL